jgi:hypothetical protein
LLYSCICLARFRLGCVSCCCPPCQDFPRCHSVPSVRVRLPHHTAPCQLLFAIVSHMPSPLFSGLCDFHCFQQLLRMAGSSSSSSSSSSSTSTASRPLCPALRLPWAACSSPGCGDGSSNRRRLHCKASASPLPRLKKHSLHFVLLIMRVDEYTHAVSAYFLQLERRHLVHQVLPPLLQPLHVRVVVELLRRGHAVQHNSGSDAVEHHAGWIGRGYTCISTPPGGWPSMSSAASSGQCSMRRETGLRDVCCALPQPPVTKSQVPFSNTKRRPLPARELAVTLHCALHADAPQNYFYRCAAVR